MPAGARQARRGTCSRMIMRGAHGLIGRHAGGEQWAPALEVCSLPGARRRRGGAASRAGLAGAPAAWTHGSGAEKASRAARASPWGGLRRRVGASGVWVGGGACVVVTSPLPSRHGRMAGEAGGGPGRPRAIPLGAAQRHLDQCISRAQFVSSRQVFTRDGTRAGWRANVNSGVFP